MDERCRRGIGKIERARERRRRAALTEKFVDLVTELGRGARLWFEDQRALRLGRDGRYIWLCRGPSSHVCLGDDQRRKPVAAGHKMRLRLDKSGPLQRSRPFIQSFGALARTIWAFRDNPGWIKRCHQVVQHGRRRFDRQQNPARRQQQSRADQTNAVRKPMETFNGEDEVECAKLRYFIGTDQRNVAVLGQQTLGTVETPWARLDHRQRDISFATQR